MEPGCEAGLRVLEQRGYQVRRVRGFSQIDVGRNQMATDALREGFQELMWIDSDVAFHPDDVERLRTHQLPFACGMYAKKSRRDLRLSATTPSPPALVLTSVDPTNGQGESLITFKYPSIAGPSELK